MRKRLSVVAALALAAMILPGCTSTLISEGYGQVKGASGVYGETQPVASYPDHTSLAKYGRVELGELIDGYAGKVPGSFFPYMKVKLPAALRDAKIPYTPGGKTLLVTGKVIYIELNQSKLGYVLGEVEEVVAEIQLVDRDSGKVLGTAICVGRTTERLNFGVEKKAEGLSKAIAAWIASYMAKR